MEHTGLLFINLHDCSILKRTIKTWKLSYFRVGLQAFLWAISSFSIIKHSGLEEAWEGRAKHWHTRLNFYGGHQVFRSCPYQTLTFTWHVLISAPSNPFYSHLKAKELFCKILGNHKCFVCFQMKYEASTTQRQSEHVLWKCQIN